MSTDSLFWRLMNGCGICGNKNGIHDGKAYGNAGSPTSDNAAYFPSSW